MSLLQVFTGGESVNSSSAKMLPNCYASLCEHIFLSLIMSFFFNFFFVSEVQNCTGL